MFIYRTICTNTLENPKMYANKFHGNIKPRAYSKNIYKEEKIKLIINLFSILDFFKI